MYSMHMIIRMQSEQGYLRILRGAATRSGSVPKTADRRIPGLAEVGRPIMPVRMTGWCNRRDSNPGDELGRLES